MLKLFLQFTEAMKKKEQTEPIKVTQIWKFVFLNPHTQLTLFQFIVDNKFTKCEEYMKRNNFPFELCVLEYTFMS